MDAVVLTCRELLGVEDLSPADNFFARGGDSLLAVELITRLEDEHGIVLPLEQVFLADSIADLKPEEGVGAES